MARSLLHQMVLKYFTHSELEKAYQLTITYHKNYIEMRSPLWDKHLTLCFSKYRDYWCINMPFEKEGEIIDFMFDIDSSVAYCEKGYYCRLCEDKKYFNSLATKRISTARFFLKHRETRTIPCKYHTF